MTRSASIVGVFGATGSGKSAYIKERLRVEAPPVLIFDPGREYRSHPYVIIEDELQLYAAINRGADRLTFRPSMLEGERSRQFGRFCTAGLALARNRGRCLVVVDELHLVVEAGSAPAGWNELVMTGRKHGVSIIASSIRPAAINKDFWTNCTHVRSGRLLFEEDQRAISRALGVTPAMLAELKSPPGAPGCDFIERDMLTGKTTHGRLTFG